MTSRWHPFPAIHAAFFFQPGCDECDRSEHDLQYIQEKYPQLVVHRFDVKERSKLFSISTCATELGCPMMSNLPHLLSLWAMAT